MPSAAMTPPLEVFYSIISLTIGSHLVEIQQDACIIGMD